MFTDPSGRFTLTEVGLGLRLYATQVVTVASPVLYTLNHAVTRLGSSQIAMFLRAGVKSFNSAVYRGVGLHQNLLRLNAWQMFEKVLNPAMRLLGARPQFPIEVGNRIAARADWLWQGRHVIDAKLGQFLNFGQLGHFINYAMQNGGTVTYITLTRTPPAIIQKAVELGRAQGVAVNFISLLPF